LRIKTYDKENMSVISVSDINEKQIREELNRDSLTYLVEEPHRREELAKYFV
jgi:predicted Zn-dependent peptidase